MKSMLYIILYMHMLTTDKMAQCPVDSSSDTLKLFVNVLLNLKMNRHPITELSLVYLHLSSTCVELLV